MNGTLVNALSIVIGSLIGISIKNGFIKEKSNDAEMIKFVKGVWNITDVFKSLNNQITECINKYKNK